MKLLSALFAELTTCSFNNKMNENCAKEMLSNIGKCGRNSKTHEQVLIYSELSVKDHFIKVDTII